jgi:hypothetical protein
VTADEFRKMALHIPQACEAAHVGHPDFRLGGKVFASLGAPDANWGMVKLTPEEQRVFMAKAPDVFTPCNGAWGKRGYTSVRLASATKTVLRPALEAAAKNVVARVKKRTT